MKLYRTTSVNEFKDFQRHDEFRTGKNTIEGKQFFKPNTILMNSSKMQQSRTILLLLNIFCCTG